MADLFATFLQPFEYAYMTKAIVACGLTGAVCAFLSAYLVLKGWSLMGDALAHAIVPGVALAAMFSLPYAVGAFFAGILAALSMSIVRQKTKLREDAVIGLVFSGFLAIGLVLLSKFATPQKLQTILLGNTLSIPASDIWQITLIALVCFAILGVKWKDFMAVFFDINHARSIGLNVTALKILFFTLLSATTVAALQTVGACLVIAMVVTPGATAYLLTDRFGRMIFLSTVIGGLTALLGAYASYFMNAAMGGLIVCLQTLLFFAAFLFAPKHGFLQNRRRIRAAKRKTV